ncbi:unnamed protein product [Brachionus calyciflorus]|uniref:Band 7 domain-containing protein n=1 Tax=Brachionus calyciflorus TaxID=104777 RepID=A0A813ZNV6_9BILA|nr:unnamed protein product [Brachionus calyciflorus]
MGFKRIRQGQKAIIVNRDGKITRLDGPKITFIILSKLEKLKPYVANENEYLIIKYIDGHVEHRKGPECIWHNRFEHDNIQVKDSFKLDDSQILVVYDRDQNTNEVNRRLVYGPCIFMPKSSEWIHQFSWHAEDPKQQGHLTPNSHKFEILNIKPDFFHYHVKEVRTLDDSLITVKLMVIYEIINVDLMLEKTQDPISDFINAICADVISMVSKMTLNEYINQSSSSLNDFKMYVQLRQRSERNGVRVKSIIYNGYTSSETLQEMQDSSIEQRTRMRINAEIDNQKNELANLRLNSEQKRFDLESDLEKLKLNFDQKCADLKLKYDLECEIIKNEYNLKISELEANSQIEIEDKLLHINEIYLENLKNLNVDLNKYQLELNKAKFKCDKLYEIV